MWTGFEISAINISPTSTVLIRLNAQDVGRGFSRMGKISSIRKTAGRIGLNMWAWDERLHAGR